MGKITSHIETKHILTPIKIQLTKMSHPLGVVTFYSALYVVFFSPILFSGRLLAPGDGMYYYLPNFYLGRMLWDPLLQSGFPVAADPQAMTWYPLSWVFSLLGSWNGFVLSAYVLGSSFTYGYVYSLTQSRLAGMASGIIYGMSGFMMAHLGHTSMIHTAAWMPLLLWGLEKQRQHFSVLWFVAACLAVALSALSGHPQIFVYTLGLSTLYAGVLGWSSAWERWKYYGSYLCSLLIGLGLASIQLIPASELVRLGPRTSMSFQEFVSYSLPPYQAIGLLFPNLFGSFRESFYGFPYFGQWSMTELTGYVGLLSFLLAAIGIATNPKRTMIWFWTGIGLFTFLLTLGDFNPIVKIIYHIPLLNKFRVPARHFLEVTFAVSVLSGLGIAAVQKQLASRKLLLMTLFSGSGLLLMALTAILLFSARLKAFAAPLGIEKIEFLPWANPAVGIPVVIFILTSAALFIWSRKSQSRFRQFLLFSCLIIDLSSFSWFAEWKYHSPEKKILIPPDFAKSFRSFLEKTSQRMLPIRGGWGSLVEIPPNISRLWGVPSASGNGPLILSRINKLLSMHSHGGINGIWSSSHNRSLDLMAVRYIFLPRQDAIPNPVTDLKGISWSKEDLPFVLGSGCGQSHATSVMINFPTPIRATKIGLVTSMGCSVSIPDETEVVSILATDTSDQWHRVRLLAGRDTSEWAFDYPDVLPFLKHRKAQVFRSFSVVREGHKGQGHHYIAVLTFGKELEIKHLKLQWGGAEAIIGIHKISLFNEHTMQSYPLSPVMNDLANPVRWRLVENMGEVSVYENLRAMPRAWLVSEVVSARKEEILHAIRSSQLPDGRTFNPLQTALVEEPFAFKAKTWDEQASAHVVHLSNTIVEVHTNANVPSFLVLSDVYYPGWKATIDGTPTHIFQTNYTLRGVMVPEGGHVVRFEFKPKRLYWGAGISVLSFISLIGFVSYQAICLRRRKDNL